MDNKLIVTEGNIAIGQSKGCWLCIQIGTWRILFKRFWSPMSNRQALHFEFFTPEHRFALRRLYRKRLRQQENSDGT